MYPATLLNSLIRVALFTFCISLIFSIADLEPKANANLLKALRLKSKADTTMERILEKHNQGQDVRLELEKAKQVKVLADQGKLDQADALLDEIKNSLNKKSSPNEKLKTVQHPGKVRRNSSDRFAVWSSTLEGKELRLLISDPRRQMSHTRVSPDGQWVLFTRYNNYSDGSAREKNGYKNTELCIIRLDGTELKTLVPPKKGILNCNGSWTHNGKRILYLSTENQNRQPLLYWMDLDSRQRTKVPTPEHLKVVSDPHQVGDTIVFPAPSMTSRPTGVWIMKTDGSQAKQLTAPPEKLIAKQKGVHHPGDYDPRISPDGTKVIVMRNYGKDVYHNIIVDIASGKETTLSQGIVAEGVAHWSSDGKLLIYRHVDPNNLKTYGLYTIRPDGTDRKKLPLPKGVLHCPQPNFFPKQGSSPTTRIIFSTEKVHYL